MAHNFFAYLSRMRYIERWSLMRLLSRENLLEHSGETAIIAHALGVINNAIFEGNADLKAILEISLFHDCNEVLIGDLPTPVKYFNKEINTAYKQLESTASAKLVSMLPTALQDTYNVILEPQKDTLEYALVKAADNLSAYVKCLEELKGGNAEFKKALKSIEKKLKACGLKEVEYFMDNFIKGYTLTLDELD